MLAFSHCCLRFFCKVEEYLWIKKQKRLKSEISNVELECSVKNGLKIFSTISDPLISSGYLKSYRLHFLYGKTAIDNIATFCV